MDEVAGFEWDAGNLEKCQKHGVSAVEIEVTLRRRPMIRPDIRHSQAEQRFQAIGKASGRYIFVAFTLRKKAGSLYIRPISARYMHRKEIEAYEKENPGLQD
jgi:uncharacterized protein